MDASPEPDHDADDAWEEDRFHSHPDFGEACFRIIQYVQNIIEKKREISTAYRRFGRSPINANP